MHTKFQPKAHEKPESSVSCASKDTEDTEVDVDVKPYVQKNKCRGEYSKRDENTLMNAAGQNSKHRENQENAHTHIHKDDGER